MLAEQDGDHERILLADARPQASQHAGGHAKSVAMAYAWRARSATRGDEDFVRLAASTSSSRIAAALPAAVNDALAADLDTVRSGMSR